MSALRGLAVTIAGRNLFAKLAATGQPLKISRVMFGTGKMPEGSTGSDLIARSELVSPLAEGSCTTPIYENDAVSMILEFRNDMHGGLSKTVWLNEYGVYAQDPDGDEILIIYGSLGDCPDSVLAYRKGVVTTRDYPISVVIGSVSDVELSFSASAFLTSQDADDLLDACIRRTVRLESVEVRIDPANWSRNAENSRFPYTARVEIKRVTAEHYPDMTLHNYSINDAFLCGLSPTVEAVDGALLFYAQEIPPNALYGTCRLLSKGLYPSEIAPDTPAGRGCQYRVIASRVRDPSKPDFGLGNEGDDEGAVLKVSAYNRGGAEVSAVIDGMLYDIDNMTATAADPPDGTLIITMEE